MWTNLSSRMNGEKNQVVQRQVTSIPVAPSNDLPTRTHYLKQLYVASFARACAIRARDCHISSAEIRAAVRRSSDHPAVL